MTVPILITEASEVVKNLHSATVTVLLLTALWSSETHDTRTALQKASQLVSCPSVAYLELNVPIKQVHQPRPSKGQYVFTSLWQNSASPSKKLERDIAVYNVTASIPFFPCIRLFVNGSSDPYTLDDVSTLGIASRIETECRCEGMTKRISRFVTPVSKDVFGNIDGRGFGVLYVAAGGIPDDMSGWDTVADGVSKRDKWVVSIVDSEKDVEVLRRNGVSNGDVVLVDFEKGTRKVVERKDVVDMEGILEDFERRRGRGERGKRKRHELLAVFRSESVGRGGRLLERSCYSGGDGMSVVWIVVYKKWCGFCQRILGVYEKVERMFKEGVHVVFVDELEDLPESLERLVDGFPTVIRAQVWGRHWEAGEYLGQHKVANILNMNC